MQETEATTKTFVKDPGDLWVEIVKTQWLTSNEWNCLLDNGRKLAMGQPNNSYKNLMNVPLLLLLFI